MLKKKTCLKTAAWDSRIIDFGNENLEDIEISEHDLDPILNLRDRLNQEDDYTQNPQTWIK